MPSAAPRRLRSGASGCVTVPGNLRIAGVVVGVADMAVGRVEQGQLATFALGSCIGLSAYDPVAQVGGLLHFMLPQPAPRTAPPESQPCLYATTGIAALLAALDGAGAKRSRLVVCAAGGAEILADAGGFAIGRRNRAMLRERLRAHGVALAAEDTGGNLARTMVLHLDTGVVRIRTRSREIRLWGQGGPADPPATGDRPGAPS